jgi:hypothetical protein
MNDGSNDDNAPRGDDRRTAAPGEGIATRWWGALRNALVDEDPVAAARRAQRPGATPATEAARSSPPAAAAAPAAAPLSPMARTLMAQVLAKASAWTALAEKLAPLEPVIADERTRYRAAWALVKGTRTVDQVAQSIELQHQPALEAEAARFAAQLQQQERTEVGARTEEQDALATRIGQAEAALAQDRERLARLTQEADAKRRELADRQRQFDAAVRAVKDALDMARATVLRHLG